MTAVVSALLSPWIGAPLGVVMMLIVAAHLWWLAGSGPPASRRRIRQANGALMLMLVPLLTAGFSLLDHRTSPREWGLVWIAAMTLLVGILMFALLDTLNTIRLRRRVRAALARRLAALRAEVRAAARERRDGAGGGRP